MGRNIGQGAVVEGDCDVLDSVWVATHVEVLQGWGWCCDRSWRYLGSMATVAGMGWSVIMVLHTVYLWRVLICSRIAGGCLSWVVLVGICLALLRDPLTHEVGVQ